MVVSVYQPLCGFSVFICVCLILSQSINKKPHAFQASVNLMPCCIKDTARFFWYCGIKALHVQIDNFIKQNDSSSVVQESTTSGNKKSVGCGSWGVGQKLKKGLGKIEGLVTLCQLCVLMQHSNAVVVTYPVKDFVTCILIWVPKFSCPKKINIPLFKVIFSVAIYVSSKKTSFVHCKPS